jgi:hypothetical protein
MPHLCVPKTKGDRCGLDKQFASVDKAASERMAKLIRHSERHEDANHVKDLPMDVSETHPRAGDVQQDWSAGSSMRTCRNTNRTISAFGKEGSDEWNDSRASRHRRSAMTERLQ